MKAFFLCTLSLCILIFACCSSPQNNERVIASNSWTAAFAQVAGIDSVAILAPFEMQHPTEYELRPGDIPRLINSKLILFAGYEVMARSLENGLEIPKNRMLQIETRYDLETLRTSVMKIASKMGTTAIAQQNLKKIEEQCENWSIQLRNLNEVQPAAIVHFFQIPMAKTLGLNIVGSFGPGPLEATQIQSLKQLNPSLIIDNLHNPVASPVAEILPEAQYIKLLNFPGLHKTQTLSDVIDYNGKTTKAAMQTLNLLP